MAVGERGLVGLGCSKTSVFARALNTKSTGPASAFAGSIWTWTRPQSAPFSSSKAVRRLFDEPLGALGYAAEGLYPSDVLGSICCRLPPFEAHSSKYGIQLAKISLILHSSLDKVIVCI